MNWYCTYIIWEIILPGLDTSFEDKKKVPEGQGVVTLSPADNFVDTKVMGKALLPENEKGSIPIPSSIHFYKKMFTTYTSTFETNTYELNTT